MADMMETANKQLEQANQMIETVQLKIAQKQQKLKKAVDAVFKAYETVKKILSGEILMKYYRRAVAKLKEALSKVERIIGMIENWITEKLLQIQQFIEGAIAWVKDIINNALTYLANSLINWVNRLKEAKTAQKMADALANMTAESAEIIRNLQELQQFTTEELLQVAETIKGIKDKDMAEYIAAGALGMDTDIKKREYGLPTKIDLTCNTGSMFDLTYTTENKIVAQTYDPDFFDKVYKKNASSFSQRNAGNYSSYTGEHKEFTKYYNGITEYVAQSGCFNGKKKRSHKIEFIVIHYTAGGNSKGGAALALAKSYDARKRNGEYASSEFIVDDDTVVQYVPSKGAKLKDYHAYAVACHVSSGRVLNHPSTQKIKGEKIGHGNTINIEVCSTLNTQFTAANPNHAGWSYSDKVRCNTINLVRQLMKDYNIDIDHVVRHYDIGCPEHPDGKACPGILGWNGHRLEHPTIPCGRYGYGSMSEVKAVHKQKNTEDLWVQFKNDIASSKEFASTVNISSAEVQNQESTKSDNLYKVTIKQEYQKFIISGVIFTDPDGKVHTLGLGSVKQPKYKTNSSYNGKQKTALLKALGFSSNQPSYKEIINANVAIDVKAIFNSDITNSDDEKQPWAHGDHNRLIVHQCFAEEVISLLLSLKQAGFIMKSLGGLQIRKVAGSSSMSNHAYGIAIDVNPIGIGDIETARKVAKGGSTGNPYIQYTSTIRNNKNSEWYKLFHAYTKNNQNNNSTGLIVKADSDAVKIFKKHGWGWGGYFGDFMHFSKLGGW